MFDDDCTQSIWTQPLDLRETNGGYVSTTVEEEHADLDIWANMSEHRQMCASRHDKRRLWNRNIFSADETNSPLFLVRTD
jgi:hypothetical protein